MTQLTQRALSLTIESRPAIDPKLHRPIRNYFAIPDENPAEKGLEGLEWGLATVFSNN